ncbi:hypothetical protein MUP95_07790 [bacterium]|nr:hypothetical protein [bacterium]
MIATRIIQLVWTFPVEEGVMEYLGRLLMSHTIAGVTFDIMSYWFFGVILPSPESSEWRS